jgi:hypothetical protein
MCLIASSVLAAQNVELTAGGVAVSNSEVTRVRQARGLGFAIGAELESRRFLLEARALTATLDADFSVQPDYALHELNLAATYWWRPALGVRLAAGRRFVSPDFAAQEVGVVGIGLSSQTRLTSVAELHGRISYLPLTEFTGGGHSGAAVELGLGVRIGRPDQPWDATVDVAYQRLDRDVSGASAPIRYSMVQIGVGRRVRHGGSPAQLKP